MNQNQESESEYKESYSVIVTVTESKVTSLDTPLDLLMLESLGLHGLIRQLINTHTVTGYWIRGRSMPFVARSGCLIHKNEWYMYTAILHHHNYTELKTTI